MKKNKKKNVSSSNYLLAIILVLGTIFIFAWIFNIAKNYQTNLYSEPYLLKSKTLNLEATSIAEIKDNTDLNSYFIMISETNNKEIYNLEKKLKPLIDDYNLKDRFYYIDATTMQSQENYFANLNHDLNLDNVIKDLPIIIYMVDGQIASEGILNKEAILAGDLAKILDIYEFNKVGE